MQHGVVGRDQLTAIGLRRGSIERRLQAGRLHRVHRGVYAVGHTLIGAEGRWMAAVLACGHGALLSHRSGGALLEIRPTSNAGAEITVPLASGRRSRAGITVHRSGALTPGDRTRRRRIPVTSPMRTLFDLAQVIPQGDLKLAVERAEALGLFDLGAIGRILDANPARRGSTALAEILDQYREPAVTRSQREDLFLDLCFAHGIPRPSVNARLGPYEVDFLWSGARLVVETDGRAHHATHAAFERDRARDARLVAWGYRVVRFTYRQVSGEPERVTGLVRSLLEGVG